MVLRSGPQQNSQLRIDSPRTKYRFSPYPSNPVAPSRSPSIGWRSTVARERLSTISRRPGGPLLAERARLKHVLKNKGARLFELPGFPSVVSGLGRCLDHLQIKVLDCCDYETLISELVDLIPLIRQPFMESKPKIVPDAIRRVVSSMKDKISKIRDPHGRSKPGQLVMEDGKGKLALSYFRSLRQEFEHLRTEIHVWGEKREQWTDARLKDLFPVHEAYYNAALPITVTKRVGCTENTRVHLLGDTQAWTQNKDGAKIFWLNGMAGTGKTTIAYTMCKWLQEDGRLAASFFCSRNSLECRNVNKMVPTIAYQLGQRGRCPHPYRHTLCTAFEEDMDVDKRNINTQFEQLIAKPLLATGKAMANMVVVIDALDECTDVHGAEVVLNMLLKHAENLPIKFFVTSRPEPAIVQRMTTSAGAMRSILWLHDIDKSIVQADIRTYLAEALQTIQVTPSELDALAERAGCLFIFAATAVRYIIPNQGAVNHRERLQKILKLCPWQGNKSHKDIDELYITILSSALDDDVFEEEELVIRRQVLWTVACASGPLTMVAITGLLSLPDPALVEVAIKPLQSVLRISEDGEKVSTLHASFPDFLLSEERAGLFYRNEVLQNAYLAERCFQIMDQSLQFNICRLESSYLLDWQVPNLQERVDRVISNELFYACRYWGDHLSKCPKSSSLMDLLDSFMRHHLLSWIEVLNLKKHVSYGDGVLHQALAWLPSNDNSKNLENFIYDARNFIVIFASSPTSLSTPHIYVSALPFTPKQSFVWVTYSPRTRGLVRVESKSLETREGFALTTWDIGNPICCIAQSSDGQRIASGLVQRSGPEGLWGVSVRDASGGTSAVGPLTQKMGQILALAFPPNSNPVASSSANRAIYIWDASDGRLIAGPLSGHTRRVNTVSFSPDGTCLASGSDDHTVRMWDTRSGSQRGDPLKGHQDGVTAVTFSPDGRHIASGSSDCSVRVWDSQTQILTQGQFEGHTRSVNSIAYSPDSLRLASGSEDQTVRVWDVSRNRLSAGPFEGHTDAVTCVTFSPDSRMVASSSRDKTIRLWESGSGTLLAGPFEGHNGWVNSVFFTFDGTRILSGSMDGTICVWDARHRTTSATKASGHTSGIYSVSLSPDGTYAASGSSDSTICVWDTHRGVVVAGPLRGHADRVNSVAFSPDGARIVSGSMDQTLRTWDASTGALLAGPFKGHTASIAAVAFSPDGNRVASGSYDCTVRIWNSYTGGSAAEPFKGLLSGVTSIAFSPDGVGLVFTANDHTVRMQDINRSTALWISNVHTGCVTCVAFSPDGTRVVSGSDDRTILVLDARSGAVLHGPFIGHERWVSSVVFSPDGRRVVSGSWDKTVRLWEVQSGTLSASPLEGHTGRVESVVISPDGARLISGSPDGTVRFWNPTAAIKPDPTFPHDLSINWDGWVTDSKWQLLLWVPPDLRKGFEYPSYANPFIIGLKSSSFIDCSTLYIGDQWHKCYHTSLSSNV